MNVRRSEVSGRGEVPGVGANLDGEGTAVTKVENHGLPSVHSPARLDLPVLYGRYRFADGLENRLQFVLGGGPIILGCSPLLACWLSIRAPSASCGRPLPSDTAHLTLAWLCPPSWERQARYKLEEVTRWLRQLARYGVPGMRPPRRVWSRPPPSPSQRSKLSSSSAFAFRSAINFSRRPLYSATASLPIRSTSREVSSTGMPSASLAPVSSTAPFGSLRLASLGVIRSLLPSTRVSYPLPDQPAPRLLSLGVLWRNLVATCPSTTIALLVLLPVAAAILAPAATRRPEQRQADYSGKAQT